MVLFGRMLNKSTILPILADLHQDIAGPVPIELIRQWAASDGSAEAHETILTPYKRTGTMVSSDSAGLSKLSGGRPLIEVMKLVSHPKEIIFSHGSAIGGRAIGIWAADNTQMIYDASIDPNDVVMQMVAAQRDIQSTSLVHVGIGIDIGSAYEIGGGLYGAQSDYIEAITEDETNADEILITHNVAARLRAPLDQIAEQRNGCGILDYKKIVPPTRQQSDVWYPAPFDRAFHEALRCIHGESDPRIAALHQERVRTKTIALVRVFDEDQSLLLDTLLSRIAVGSVIYELARAHGLRLIKSTGSLAILTSDNDESVLEFAQAVIQKQRDAQIPTNVGIAKGDVLCFDLDHGSSDIAGGPVNIASKLAEDTTDRYVIFIESSVPETSLTFCPITPFQVEKSRVLITGWRIG